MESKKRRPIASALFSVIAPGLGQMYNGQITKGIIFYIVCFILLPVLGLTGLQYQFNGLIIFVALSLCFYFFIIGDAVVVSIKRKEFILKPYNKWYFYILFILISFGISGITDNFVDSNLLGIKSYRMPSGSMIPTLLIDDYIITDVKIYKKDQPQRGDLVIFKFPNDPNNQENEPREMIKRVIGVGGDKIEIKNKKVFINGVAVDEPYAVNNDKNSVATRDDYGPKVVPQGKFFVMGDNRDFSYDSRFWGFIKYEDITAKVIYIYWAENKDRIGMEIQ